MLELADGKGKSPTQQQQQQQQQHDSTRSAFLAGQSEERVQALSIIMLHLCSGLQNVQEPAAGTASKHSSMRRQRSQYETVPDAEMESFGSTSPSGAGGHHQLGSAVAGSTGGRKSPFRSRRLSVCRKRALGIFQRSASVSAAPPSNASSGCKSESAN
uniref:Uncharacterized protein n=1 Tax=Anopheles atroparvus TaxID=41427 RepID=A0A182IYM2_ANOAO